MKIKNTIRIAGRDFTIEYVKGLPDDGSTDFATNRILIRDELTADNKQSTVLHEIIEALNGIYDLNLPHQTIQTLEAGIFQIYKDNF
jgi:hypothetical protein